jgi:glycosyltransferase involved in cell wall biosynthesis
MIRITAPHHIFFLTDQALKRYCAAMPAHALARHRLHVLQSCSDLDPLPNARVDPDRRYLVMTGRDSYQKNLTAALRLFAGLPETYHLVLCGPGTESPTFQRGLAAFLTVEQQARVLLRGPLSDIRPELAQAVCYLLTSRYEGLPLGALEAWEAGLPLALARIDGTSDILEQHPLATGLDLSNEGGALSRDAHAVDALVTRFLQDPHYWHQRITAEWAARHSFEPWAAQLRAHVQDMLHDA